jgi:hypothetical protein
MSQLLVSVAVGARRTLLALSVTGSFALQARRPWDEYNGLDRI